jgi:hypothetical protein
VVWPVLAGTVRMIVAALLGWWAVVEFEAVLSTLFLIVALAAVLSALIVAASFAGAWRRSSKDAPMRHPNAVA